MQYEIIIFIRKLSEIYSITFKDKTYALFEYREYNPYIKRLVVNVNDLVFTQVDNCPFTDYVY